MFVLCLHLFEINLNCRVANFQVPKALTASFLDGRLVALEKRVTDAEHLVDKPDSLDDFSKTSRKSIVDMIEDLRLRVHLLRPAHVDGLHGRVAQLLSKFQQVIQFVFRKLVTSRC